MSTKTDIESAVQQFMGTRRVCYATPGTDRHTSNFYGDERICRFTRAELVALIECAAKNWTDSENDERPYSVEAVAEMIIDDMQLDRPAA